jgi:UBA-like domain
MSDPDTLVREFLSVCAGASVEQARDFLARAENDVDRAVVFFLDDGGVIVSESAPAPPGFDLTPERQVAFARFLESTGATRALAFRFLEDSSWDVLVATDRFFTNEQHTLKVESVPPQQGGAREDAPEAREVKKSPGLQRLEQLSVSMLKQILQANEISHADCLERGDLLARVRRSCPHVLVSANQAAMLEIQDYDLCVVCMAARINTCMVSPAVLRVSVCR